MPESILGTRAFTMYNTGNLCLFLFVLKMFIVVELAVIMNFL